MALQGTLDTCTTSQLLNLINLAQKSGTLTIFSTGTSPLEEIETGVTTTSKMLKRVKIVFTDGVPVVSFVQMRDLVALLRRAGKLTRMQTEWLEARIGKAGEKAQALALIEGNFATRDEILEYLEAQLREDLHAVLMWVDGAFLFEEHVPELENHIEAAIDLEDVLVEHGAHVREVKRVTQEIPTLSATLQFTPDVDERLQRTRLSGRAWRVVSAVKPDASIRQIARLNDMDAMEVRRVVINLIQAGVLEIGEPVVDAEEIEPLVLDEEITDPTILDTLIDGIYTAAEKLVGPEFDQNANSI